MLKRGGAEDIQGRSAVDKEDGVSSIFGGGQAAGGGRIVQIIGQSSGQSRQLLASTPH